MDHSFHELRTLFAILKQLKVHKSATSYGHNFFQFIPLGVLFGKKNIFKDPYASYSDTTGFVHIN
jgi:hypothetical protein